MHNKDNGFTDMIMARLCSLQKDQEQTVMMWAIANPKRVIPMAMMMTMLNSQIRLCINLLQDHNIQRKRKLEQQRQEEEEELQYASRQSAMTKNKAQRNIETNEKGEDVSTDIHHIRNNGSVKLQGNRTTNPKRNASDQESAIRTNDEVTKKKTKTSKP